MDTPIQLYPDFTLTQNNCHEEPIHRPVAIQGRGHMLILSDDSSLNVHAISSELPQLLQCSEDVIWTSPINDWFPVSLSTVIQALVIADSHHSLTLAGESTRWSSFTKEAFDVIAHRHQGCIVVEWEPAVEPILERGTFVRTARRIANTTHHEELYTVTTALIAEAFEFDRVMVYQFDKDNHGCVVGEARRPHLEPFLGLHYPESDIPKIARELFLRIKSRFISDINTKNITLSFNPALGPHPPHLDLTYSQLRATSPIHIEYLNNMGVTGTLSISIVINGKLWGLIACHHYSTKTLPFDHRVLSEAIGDLLAKRILELDIKRNAVLREERRAIEDTFLEKVRHSDNYRIEILENASSLMAMCDCNGAALVTLDDYPFTVGTVPDNATLMDFRQWLVDHNHMEIFETSSARTVFPLGSSDDSNFGGVLAVCVSTLSQSFIFWFRPLITKTTNWAGDPDNSYTVEKDKHSNQIRINPRQSFQKWKQTVDGQSSTWEPDTLEMAQRLRDGIFRKELIYSATLAKRANDEFMQLTFAAAHDLQEPLRTQANYLELIEETLNPQGNEEISSYLTETMRSGGRMSNLINDLLTYSSLSNTIRREIVSLDELMMELLEDLRSSIDASGAVITSEALPIVLSDRNRMKQLLQNLLTNAIKYVNQDTQPIIHVFIKEEGSYKVLCVKDNGIGIDPSDHENIFKMFQRLHRKTEYEGTGIGLATCKKVVDSLEAAIEVESELGSGSTFLVKFHNSMFPR